MVKLALVFNFIFISKWAPGFIVICTVCKYVQVYIILVPLICWPLPHSVANKSSALIVSECVRNADKAAYNRQPTYIHTYMQGLIFDVMCNVVSSFWHYLSLAMANVCAWWKEGAAERRFALQR